MQVEKTSYKQVRDLSGVFGESFRFIRLNFKALYGSLFLFSGPFLLISVTVTSLVVRSFFGITWTNLNNNSFGSGSNLIMAYLTAFLILLIGISVYNVVLFKTVIDNENLKENEGLSIKLIAADFFKHYWRILGNMLLYFFVLVLSVSTIFMFVGIFIALIAAAGGVVGGVVGIFLLILIMLLIVPVLSYLSIASLFI
jgi:hypothetical protein